MLSGACWIRRDAMNPIKIILEHKPNFKFCQAKVEKIIRLADKDFENFLQSPMDYQEFINENVDLMHMDESGIYHCLLVTGEGHRDGVLVEAEGYGYARYASYVPDAAALAYDSLSEIGSRLAFLVDLFVTEGAAAASEGYWEISFEKIREQSDLEFVWHEWAKEMEGYDKGGEPERAGRTAEEFLGELVRCFHAIQERHGDEVAGQVISLAEIHSCIFPWEMKQAAEYLAAGGSVHDILPLSKEGVLEDFSDGGQKKTPVQSM